MNWRWLIPVWGLLVALDDFVDNYANDFMEKRMLPIVMYQIFIVALTINIIILVV